MIVGMCKTDTRRHYYHEQITSRWLKDVSLPVSYYIRYCDWLVPETPVVISPASADCKRCLKKAEWEKVKSAK